MSQADVMGSRGWIISYVVPPSIETGDAVYFIQKQRIYNAIINAVLNGVFLPVSFDADTNLMTIGDLDSDRILPQTFLIDELSCGFGDTERYRREYVQERDSWSWLLRLKFNQNTLFEIFEKNILNDPIMIDRDAENDLAQVILHLKNAEYEHPVRQGSSTGSSAAYVIEARLNRK